METIWNIKTQIGLKELAERLKDRTKLFGIIRKIEDLELFETWKRKTTFWFEIQKWSEKWKKDNDFKRDRMRNSKIWKCEKEDWKSTIISKMKLENSIRIEIFLRKKLKENKYRRAWKRNWTIRKHLIDRNQTIKWKNHHWNRWNDEKFETSLENQTNKEVTHSKHGQKNKLRSNIMNIVKVFRNQNDERNAKTWKYRKTETEKKKNIGKNPTMRRWLKISELKKNSPMQIGD